jgi:hypothetical protein
MELHVGAAFAVIARELFETGAEPAVVRIAARAIDDEITHAELCLKLAEHHDGRARAWPAPEPLFVPEYAGVSGALRTTLHLVAMSCLNETIATVRLGEAVRATESPVVASALRAILADEVVHARAGWAHLSSRFVGADAKSAVGHWLPELLGASLRSLIDENAALPGDGFARLGLPSVSATRAVALAAIDDVVLPGFDAVGVPTDRARAWRADA